MPVSKARKNVSRVVCLAACICAGVAATANPALPSGIGPQRWIAVSTTATSITGDVRFTPQALTFSTGTRLSIAYVKRVGGAVGFVSDSSRNASGSLFRVVSAADPELIAGNRFCGRKPTFITIRYARSRTQPDVFLSVYSGSAAPRGQPGDSLCAGYAYARALH